MRRDPTQFRERFKQWKNGLPAYKNGRPLSFQDVNYDTSNSQYYDIMERVAEQNNAEWNRLRAKDGAPTLSVDEEYLRVLNDNSYNYKGYYSKYPNGKGNAIDHWDDEFKTVYHPTFSNESIYSGKKSQYNPQGVIGGRWDGDNYIPVWGLKLHKYEDVRIPLVERDSFKLNDIRYSLLLPIIGLVGTAYGLRYVPQYKYGKDSIKIKPANRGKFTELKKRTGHSASWFKANGTPALKKMAVFALNARKWKH